MIIILLTTIYCIFTLALSIAWLRIKSFNINSSSNPDVKISVIIVVRNEENNILPLLNDLNRQTYHRQFMEVIIVDDHSSDHTVSIVENFKEKAIFSLTLLRLEHYITEALYIGNYKKMGIELAVKRSIGELIITTDGDCRVSKYWLSAFSQFYLSSQAQFIAGPVTFYREKTLFERLQTVEFASLIGSGAALLRMGLPVMCNGANLAYTKQAFLQVKGYADTSGTPSGDDIFLLQKVLKAYPGKVHFLRSKDAIVYTPAKLTWQDFFQQRKRWASKWNMYPDKRASRVAILVFFCNFSLLVALLLVLSGNYPLRMFLIQIAIRFSVEFVFLSLVLGFLNKFYFIAFILPLQMIYFLYVSFFGLITGKKGYEWKGRKLK